MVDYSKYLPKDSDLRAKGQASEKPVSGPRKREPEVKNDDVKQVVKERSWLTVS